MGQGLPALFFYARKKGKIFLPGNREYFVIRPTEKPDEKGLSFFKNSFYKNGLEGDISFFPAEAVRTSNRLGLMMIL